jgi:6,7-dimethyl-8-ribityllumazine synthase
MSDEHHEPDEDVPGESGRPALGTEAPAEAPGAFATSPGAPPPYEPPPAIDEDEAAAEEALGGDPLAEQTVISEAALLQETPPPGGDEPEPQEPTEDPFAAWPQAADAELIEAAPSAAVKAEHAAGEIDVPDGYTVLEGAPSGHHRSVAIVVSRYNGDLTNRMLARAIEALEQAGVSSEAVTIMPVPGAFELPLAAMALAKTRRYACVVALGVIVRGETPHFDYIASEAASGLQLAAIETGVPVAFGVLTVESAEQAEARIDRAGEAVQTALEMADVFAQLRASARA